MIIHDDPLRCGEELNYAEGLLEHRYQVPAVQYTVKYHDYHACSPGGYIELRDIGRNFMRKRWFPRRTKC